MRIGKELRFEAAHVLPKHPGKCKNLHGHSYVVYLEIEGPIDHETGMVLDYVDLKRVLHEQVYAKLDHRFINDVFLEESWPGETTAENIVMYIWRHVESPLVSLGARVTRVRVCETATSWAERTVEDGPKSSDHYGVQEGATKHESAEESV